MANKKISEFGFEFETSVDILVSDEDFERLARNDKVESFGFVFEKEFVDPNISTTIDKTFEIGKKKQFNQVKFTNDVLDMQFETVEPQDIAQEEGIEKGLLVGAFSDIPDVNNSIVFLRQNPFPPKFNPNTDTKESFTDKQIKWMESKTIVENWIEGVTPMGITSIPLTETEIEEQASLERRLAVEKFIQERPEDVKVLIRKSEDELIKTFLKEKGEPTVMGIGKLLGFPETTEGVADRFRRPLLLKKAQEHELNKLEEEGVIPSRRKSRGFFSEFGRSLGKSTLDRTSQVLTFIERFTAPASVFEPEFFSDLADKAKKASESPSLNVGKGTPIRSFVASSIADGITFTGATIAATLTGGPVAGLSVAFVVEGESTYEEIIAAGGTEEQAAWGMLVVGGINAALEQLRVNQIISFGRGGANTSFKKVADAIKSKSFEKIAAVGGDISKDVAVNAISESIQEVLQEADSLIVPAILGVKLATFEEAVTRVAKAGAGGAIAGPVVGGGGAIAAALVESGISQDRADLVEDMLARGESVETIVESAKSPQRRLVGPAGEDVERGPSGKPLISELFKPTEPSPEAPVAPSVTEPAPEGVAIPLKQIAEEKKAIKRLKKEVEEEVRNDPIFEIESEAKDITDRLTDIGVISIPPNFRGEAEAAIESFPQLKFHITFDPQKGKAPDTFIAEALGRNKLEGDIAETHGHMNIEDFLELVGESLEGRKKIGGIPEVLLNKMRESGNPFSEITALKHTMLHDGFTVDEINDSIKELEFDPEFDIDIEPLLLKGKTDVEKKQRIPEKVEDKDKGIERQGRKEEGEEGLAELTLPEVPPEKRIISRDAFEAAKKRLIDPTILRAGLDPQQLKDAVIVGGFLVESGVRKFADWSVRMVKEIGEHIRPHLRTIWNSLQAEKPTEIDRVSEEAQQKVVTDIARVKSLPKQQQRQIETESVAKVKERISFKKPKVSIRQHFKNLLFKTDKAFRDEFAGLRRVVEAAGAEELAPADDPVQLAVAFTQKSSAKTRSFVMESTTDLAGNRKSKSLKQIFTPLIKDGGKKRFEDFVTYLVAARDLNLQKRNIETGIDPVASQLAFDALDSPEFARAVREVTEWNQKGIDLLVESGRITRESGEAIKLANPIYAPFFREFEEEPGIARKGKKFTPKRIKGSKRKIVDPIEGMIQQMEATISSAQRAAIERSMANLATENPEALEDFITPTRAPVVPTKLTVKEIKAELEEIGIDFSGVSNEDLNELLTIFRPSAFPATQGVIKLKVAGENKFFKAEKELLEILDGLDVYKLGPFWDFVVGKPTRLLKLGATGLNAAFGLIRNPARDIQTFFVTSKFAKAGPFSAISGVLKDIKTKAAGVAENFGFNSLKKSEDLVKFAALGGEMSGFITQDRAGTKHLQHDMLASNGIRYTINTFAHPIDALRNLISVTEIGVRIGEFSPALKEGERLYGKGSLSASVFALNAAQDVTTNFSRHGQIGKQLNQIIPFFNVAIQGPDKIIRSFRERPFKSTIAAVSSMTIPALFFWWRNKDKPWYQNMTAHEKANYIHFESPSDETVIMRFPVAFELGHIFQAVPVAFLDAVHNSRPEEILDILKATLKTANPLDWPSLIGPIIDIKANEDFAGRPIVSRSDEGKLPEDQFGPHTTELMKVIGKTLNMSPSQIEHAVNSYSGGIYNRVARMLKNNDTEKQPADIPVIGTLFLRDPFAPRKQVEKFYKEREELNKKFQSKKITTKEVLRRVVINNIASVLNVNFDKLKNVKTTKQRKKIWSEIGRAIELSNKLAPK